MPHIILMILHFFIKQQRLEKTNFKKGWATHSASSLTHLDGGHSGLGCVDQLMRTLWGPHHHHTLILLQEAQQEVIDQQLLNYHGGEHIVKNVICAKEFRLAIKTDLDNVKQLWTDGHAIISIGENQADGVNFIQICCRSH